MTKSEIEFAERQKEKLIELVGQKVCGAYSPTCDEHQPHDCGKCYANDCRIADIADHLIANGVTVQEWIPVTERLPKGAKEGETSENVIVHTTDGEVTTGWLDAFGSDRWWLVIGTDDSHTCWGLGYVTHWMPLPQPPKGE